MKKSVVVLIVAVTLALTSCGGKDSLAAASGSGSDEDAASASGDPCELFTIDELQSMLGRTFDEGEQRAGDALGGEQCVWTTPDGLGTVSATVWTDSAIPDSAKDAGRTLPAIFGENADFGTNPEPVDGLGDKAVINHDETITQDTWIHVLDGDAAYMIGVSHKSVTPAATMRDLAALALD